MASPEIISHGNVLNTEIEYAILGSGDSGIPVQENQVVSRDGEEYAVLLDKAIQREDGVWIVTNPIEINPDIEPGNYVLEQSILVSDIRYSKRTPFTVTPRTAAWNTVTYGESQFVIAGR